MKKSKVLVVCAVLSVLSVGCQKEEINTSFDYAVSQNDTRYHLYYMVDGVKMHTSFDNPSEMSDFLQYLTTLTFQGHQVTVCTKCHNQAASAKDVVKFETKDEVVFNKWVAERLNEGYDVSFYYDKERSVYVGTATKQ